MRPYTIMLTTVAPIKDEYFARGPSVCTACDSTSPGVSENRVNDAISGINRPSANNLRSKDIVTATAPATRPPTKNDFDEILVLNSSLLVILDKFGLI